MRRLFLLLLATLGGWPCYADEVETRFILRTQVEQKPPPKKPKNPNALNVVTDTTWLFSDTLVKGWEETKFEDTTWKNVVVVPGPDENGEHYKLANQMGQATDAAWIWSATSETSYLRKTFDTPKEIRRAEVMFIADDVADIYVNGTLVSHFSSAQMSWGHRGCAKLLDLAPYFVPGERNVIAAKVVNKGSCKGFAVDLRINDDSFIPELLVKAFPKPSFDVVARVKELFVECDNPNFRKREAATRELQGLVEKHGQVLYDVLNELRLSGSLEQEWRVGTAWAALKKERNAAFEPTGYDGRFYYPRAGLAYAKQLLAGDEDANITAYRHLVQLKIARDENKTVFDAAFRTNWTKIGKERRHDTIVALSFLDWADFADLIDAERDNDFTDGKNVAVAIAYGRMQNLELSKDRVHWLKSAKASKHEPTARAATAALLARGVKE
jgi:hypothetical protein